MFDRYCLALSRVLLSRLLGSEDFIISTIHGDDHDYVNVVT